MWKRVGYELADSSRLRSDLVESGRNDAVLLGDVDKGIWRNHPYVFAHSHNPGCTVGGVYSFRN